MGESKQVLVHASGLSYAFDGQFAVDGLELTVRRGEVLGLLGPNGAGKSTALRLLTGTLAPDAGTITVCGYDLVEQPLQAKQHIGFLPERPPLYPELTADEYLMHCARLRRVRRRDAQAAVDAVKQRCGLEDCGRRRVGNLSLGFRQRVGIAQAIVHRPSVIILDEPTIGLDPVQNSQVRALLTDLAAESALVLSSHILTEVESVCTHVQILHRGRSVFTAPIGDLERDRRGPIWVRVVLRRPPDLEHLRSLPGIVDATDSGGSVRRILCADKDPSLRALLDAASKGDWGLMELAPERPELEQVFLSSVLEET